MIPVTPIVVASVVVAFALLAALAARLFDLLRAADTEAEEWSERAIAAERRLVGIRSRRSAATAKGNRTRAARRRDAIAEKARLIQAELDVTSGGAS